MTSPKKIIVKQKVWFAIERDKFKEVEEAINEHYTGKKLCLEKDVKGDHKKALDQLWQRSYTTLSIEVDCATGKKTHFRNKKNNNIFEMEVLDL